MAAREDRVLTDQLFNPSMPLTEPTYLLPLVLGDSKELVIGWKIVHNS